MENFNQDKESGKFQTLLFKFIVLLTRNRDEALNIIQNVNYLIFKNRNKFRLWQYPSRMSFTFIKNYFISRSRNKNKVMYLKQENQYSIFDEYDVALYNRIFILNIVKNMNVRDRVLIGFLILRKNYDEIGRALGINEEQVKERVYNLREKIECLFPELFNK